MLLRHGVGVGQRISCRGPEIVNSIIVSIAGVALLVWIGGERESEVGLVLLVWSRALAVAPVHIVDVLQRLYGVLQHPVFLLGAVQANDFTTEAPFEKGLMSVFKLA